MKTQVATVVAVVALLVACIFGPPYLSAIAQEEGRPPSPRVEKAERPEAEDLPASFETAMEILGEVAGLEQEPEPAPLLDTVLEPRELTVSEPEYVMSWASVGTPEILKSGDKVFVLAESLERQPGYLARFKTDEVVPWVEVRRSGALLDEYIDHVDGKPGEFLVPGDPGEKVGVKVPKPDGFAKPIGFVLEFPGEPEDPEPEPPVDPPGSDAIEKLSRARADALNDPTTRVALKSAIESELDQLSEDASLSDAVDAAVGAIETALGQRRGASEDVPWKPGWRTPVSNAIKAESPGTGAEYKSLMSSAAKGL